MPTPRFIAKTNPWMIGLSALAIAAAAGLSAWAAGGTQSFSVAYQGYLEDNGNAFSGTVDLSFSLYPDAQPATAGGWQEAHAAVQVMAGRFSATLGETTPLSAALLKNNPFLGITITGRDGAALATAVALEGRQLLTAVPYAWRAAPGQDFAIDGNLSAAGSASVGGDVAIGGKHALRGSDTWLRLNQDGDFSSGTHTPGLFAPNSLNVGGSGGWVDPGGGNARVAGNASVAGSVSVGVDLNVGGWLRSGSMEHSNCQDIITSIPGVNFSDVRTGHILTQCPNGKYMTGIYNQHYQEGGNFRDRWVTYIRCCNL